MPVQVFDAADTARLLPYSVLLEALRQVALQYAAGQVRCPERLVVPLPQGGVMLSMPAVAHDLAVHKLVNVCPVNREANLPTIQGMVTAYQAVAGTPLFTLDAPTVTARRTAGISVLGVQVLHGEPRHVVVIGTGGQALGHVQALAAVFPEARITVVGRTLEKAQSFAQRVGHSVQVAELVPDNADVVIAATTSKTPVYTDQPRAGRLVVGVGAFTPDAAELSQEVVQGSDLFVDDPTGAQHEAGDFIQAGVNWAQVRPLAHGLQHRPDRSRPLVFKTVGCAAWDLAACRVVQEQLGLA